MNESDIILGSTITDNISEISRIVSRGDNDITVDRYHFGDDIITHDVSHILLNKLAEYNSIDESLFIKAEDLFQKTMTQVFQILNDADKLPADYSDGKGICRAPYEYDYHVLYKIHYKNLVMAELETVILDESSISSFYQNTMIKNISQEDGALISGFDPKVIDKITKITRMSIMSVQASISPSLPY